VSHSHQDFGWLITAEEYFEKNVNAILTNVMIALESNPKRKFTHAEIGFFEMWWRNQTVETKRRVRDLVSTGQLEFVNGGWIASDEACPIYSEILHNIQVGHDFLARELFVSAPKVAWHMDSFGHSATLARAFEELGFDALFYSRMNETLKTTFKET
jgi:alpha-mannosidase